MNKLYKYLLYLGLGINLSLIVFFWWNNSAIFLGLGISGILYALGKLLGLLAVYFVLLQFVLMGRAVWIEKSFGLDKLARIHRLNGYLSILFILLHPLFLIISGAIDNKVTAIDQFIDYFQNYDDIPQAVLAVLIFVFIVFSSIYIARKKLKYESWYFIHLLTYLGILFAFGHQIKLGSDFQLNQIFAYYWYGLYIFVFGNLIFFRLLVPLYNFHNQRFAVKSIIAETSDTNSVYIETKNVAKLKIEAGQFFILRFLNKKLWWQAHPFSLSDLPKNNQLRFTIKKCGDFTSEITNIRPGTKVWLEGPFGVFTAAANLNQKFLFIAGGVGITPLRVLMEKVAPTNQVTLLYNNKTSQDVIFKKELDELAGKHRFTIHYVMSDETAYSGEKGRIDKEKIQRLVSQLAEHQIYICGPPPMLKSIQAILLNELKVPSQNLHYEIFAF